MNKLRMRDQLLLHEGLRLRPYQDTEGYWTWLVGYNLDARGVDEIERVLGRSMKAPKVIDPENPWDWLPELSRGDALKILDVDIDRYEKAVKVHFPPYKTLDEVRQRVVLDMAFNMGFRALGFKKFAAALIARDWSKASRELWNSRWSRQVGDGPGKKEDRCDRLSRMVLTGEDYAR